jgi:cell division protein FtsL
MKIKFDKIRKSFIYVFGGSVLTEDFLLKNMRFIVTVLIIIFIFIGHRYTVLQKMAEIEKLERELKDAKYEALSISADLTKASRLTEIERLIEEEGLELKISNEPVYRIRKK